MPCIPPRPKCGERGGAPGQTTAGAYTGGAELCSRPNGLTVADSVVAAGWHWHPVRPMRRRLAISPRLYAKVAFVALAALVLIVMTGAAVRMTGSGLGCSDWPKCYGRTIAPLESHAVIEYTNRLLSGVVA